MLSNQLTPNVCLSLYTPPLISVVHDLKHFLRTVTCIYDTPNWTQFVFDCGAIIHANVHACMCVCVRTCTCVLCALSDLGIVCVDTLQPSADA